MAIKEFKVCDIFGSRIDVKSYKVQLTQVYDDREAAVVAECTADLCPRGLQRLKKFIHRGMTPPQGRCSLNARR